MATTREPLLASSSEAAKELNRLARDEPERVGSELLRIAGDPHAPGNLRILACQNLSTWKGDFSGAYLRQALDDFVRGVERDFPSRRLDEIGAEAQRCPWLREMWILVFIAKAILGLGHPAGLPWAMAVKEALRGSIAEESLTLLVRRHTGDRDTGGWPPEQGHPERR